MPTVNINVELDTSANPPVTLTDSSGNSARTKTADDGDTVKWMKKDNDDNFNITSLSPTGDGEAFSTAQTGGSGQWLSSTFQPPEGSSENEDFAYTLTVTVGSATYTTTKTSNQPDDDRPVIRNGQ